MATTLELAYEHCRHVAKEQARNFYYAFRTLPAHKRRAIYAVYAFCRYCDDIADEPLPADERPRRFGLVREMLSSFDSGDAADPLFAALQDASRTFEIPASYYSEIVDGVEMDLTWTRFRDFDELRAYCYKVASVVGLICVEIFGYKDARAREYAVDLGIAMQLTNILRDIREDADRGRIYIPQDELERFGYSEAELTDGVVNNAFRALMEFQVARARRYFDNGARLMPLLSPDSRACPAVLRGLYRTLLDRIEAAGYDVFGRRIRLSSAEKFFLAARIWVSNAVPALPILRR